MSDNENVSTKKQDINDDNQHAPTLRFKEFDDDWNKFNLGKISNIKKGFTPSTKNKEFWQNGEFNWLSISDMGEKYIFTTKKKITKKALKNRDIIPKNTLLMSFKLTIGKLGILKKDMYTNEAIANFQWKNDKICTEFMYYYLSTLNIKKYGSQAAKGITLNNDTLNSIPVFLPSHNEQIKISKFLSLIDEKIDLLEKRYIQNNKQFEYYLNMIMEEKLNFSKGNTEWVEYYIKDITFIPKKDKIKKFTSNDKLLTVKLHTKGIFINNNIKPKLTKKGRPYYKRYSDELLIGRQNFHNGGIGIVPNELNGGVCSNAISSFCVNKEKVLLKFLYYYLSRKNYYERCEKYVGGTGQKEFSEKQLLKLKIRIPKLEEQKNIIKFLDLISNRNKLIKNNLELLKQFKKGLLQKMFVR